jgi:hypothetical protein
MKKCPICNGEELELKYHDMFECSVCSNCFKKALIEDKRYHDSVMNEVPRYEMMEDEIQ